MVAPPVRCEGDEAPARAAPRLGADTDAILGDMGYDAGRIGTLRAQKVI
jgi:crotonobetainyl-CoA:carnitine CoA-transferase CaiB-like acyl-CoA transferase